MNSFQKKRGGICCTHISDRLLDKSKSLLCAQFLAVLRERGDSGSNASQEFVATPTTELPIIFKNDAVDKALNYISPEISIIILVPVRSIKSGGINHNEVCTLPQLGNPLGHVLTVGTDDRLQKFSFVFLAIWFKLSTTRLKPIDETAP